MIYKDKKMKKLVLFFAMFALLPMLLLGCDPPQNKNAQKKGDGTVCDCGHDHGAEGHDHSAEGHEGHDHAGHDH